MGDGASLGTEFQTQSQIASGNLGSVSANSGTYMYLSLSNISCGVQNLELFLQDHKAAYMLL